MSLSSLVAPHLPYLRRLARALTGSQPSGDAYAAAALEALIDNPELLAGDIPTRVALYRILLKIWPEVHRNNLDFTEPGASIVGSAERNAQRNLAAIDWNPRAAFLLDVLEGLSRDEIGLVLDISPIDVDELIQRASREISAQIASDVLIIEDEPIIAMDIEALVEGLGHRVTGIARTQREALASIEEHKPGLILADIQLADGSSGLEAVNEILAHIEVPVIFITAYPERLLTGERPEPTFLITKPFSVDVVKAVISQALFFGQQARRSEPIAHSR